MKKIKLSFKERRKKVNKKFLQSEKGKKALKKYRDSEKYKIVKATARINNIMFRYSEFISTLSIKNIKITPH